MIRQGWGLRPYMLFTAFLWMKSVIFRVLQRKERIKLNLNISG
jgi:hypothetical protein